MKCDWCNKDEETICIMAVFATLTVCRLCYAKLQKAGVAPTGPKWTWESMRKK